MLVQRVEAVGYPGTTTVFLVTRAQRCALTGEQRNVLARLLFEEVRVNDDRVVAVKPQPSFASQVELDRQA